mmetsp:Transcript_34458/g.50531  ORF Transcript_34458/g.50531 Transcript_34458/m.50531 type:complete len:80 (+) Transcript_34458:108-347(+)
MEYTFHVSIFGGQVAQSLPKIKVQRNKTLHDTFWVGILCVQFELRLSGTPPPRRILFLGQAVQGEHIVTKHNINQCKSF